MSERVRAATSVVELSDLAASVTHQLRKETPYAVVFVDLCASSSLKVMPQEEWLPIICRFLLVVSRLVRQHRGLVVKFIGDEVMAVFDDKDGTAVQRAEGFALECAQVLHNMDQPYVEKLSLDYGQVADVRFQGFPMDVLGTAVDRCARIAKLAKRKTILASGEFVASSKNAKSWRLLGKVNLRGLPSKTTIYQHHSNNETIVLPDKSLISLSQEQLIQYITELRDSHTRCKEELRNLRKRKPI